MNTKEITKIKTVELQKTNNKTYDFQVTNFSRWLNGSKPTPDNVKTYLETLAETKAPSTVALAKVAIKKAIEKSTRDLANRAMIDTAFKSIKTVKQDKKVYKDYTLTKDESQAIKLHLPEKLQLVYETLDKTGLRVSELINIKIRDVAEQKTHAVIKIVGKGKKERHVFIGLEILDKIKTAFNNETYLFCNRSGDKFSRQYLTRQINHAGRKEGLAISAHSLRHTFATEKIKVKGSVKAVSQYLGHSTTAITESMYNHDQLSLQDLGIAV